MHVLLIPIGSAGDVYPFVGLGLTLRARGHRVTLITSAYFESLAQRLGLDFVPLGTIENFEDVLVHPDAWHPLRSFHLVAHWGMLETLPLIYENIASRYVSGQTVVAAGSLALGARVAQDKLGVPVATVHLQPVIFRSLFQSPRLPGNPVPAWTPAWYKRAMYWLGDTLVLDRVVTPRLNAFRAEQGLPPVRRVFHRWIHSPRCVLGLFPEWFFPLQPDWPPHTHLTGFPLYDAIDAEPLTDEIRAFLDAGEPPVVFTPGSAMRQAQTFFAESVSACRILGRRGLLLTRFAEQVPDPLPPNVRHFAFAPFSQLLPRCAALVHHGGIGTSSQALAAGIPQVVMPMAHDQPDNAERMRRLGVARWLRPRAFRGSAVAKLLEELLGSGEVAVKCKEVASRFHQVDARSEACRVIEELGER
jgi:UDP:flavonoid glycosyltransferase YjiC (YdhE family)